MQQIKEAFQKVKYEMDFLKNEIDFLKSETSEIKEQLMFLTNFVENTLKNSTDTSTHISQSPTIPTHPSTHNLYLESLKPQYLDISIRNEGVPTDKQTNRQTDTSTHFIHKNSFSNALEALESLDSIKKEIRLKFKRLTEQEMLVFSTLYQLCEEKESKSSDYKELSSKLNLSESSIRDYVGRLTKKGIPVDKTKLNNKNIKLSISSDLKKIASLSTILELRSI